MHPRSDNLSSDDAWRATAGGAGPGSGLRTTEGEESAARPRQSRARVALLVRQALQKHRVRPSPAAARGRQ